jgi:hypothetical protein
VITTIEVLLLVSRITNHANTIHTPHLLSLQLCPFLVRLGVVLVAVENQVGQRKVLFATSFIYFFRMNVSV